MNSNVSVIRLVPDRRHFASKVLDDLLSSGWALTRVPANGKVPNNGLKLMLKGGEHDLHVRIFLYKVTSSSRGRPHERRIEITSTYLSGLPRAPGFSDVVLGVDPDSGRYVGVDPRRLRMGGATHNGSSFFDREGLEVPRGKLRVNPRAVTSARFPGGIETHAFFDGTRLAEYLFSRAEIHAGQYGYAGPFSGPVRWKKVSLPTSLSARLAVGETFVLSSRSRQLRKPSINAALLRSLEEGDLSRARRSISPQQLKQVLALWDEIGALGEQVVLTFERDRLRRLGFASVAAKVRRVSLTSVAEGYDISSFEDDGKTKRYIEVKSTTGSGLIVDMSKGEWTAATKHRRHYYLARVLRVKTTPELRFIRDPAELDRNGLVTRVPTGWRVDLRSAPTET